MSKEYQNYETIDKHSLSANSYIKLSRLIEEEPPHCLVEIYKTVGSAKNGDLTITLMECYHFIGELAEYESLSYFCTCVPELADDSSIKTREECSTYKPEMDYIYTPEKQLQEDKNRAEYTQAHTAASTRTAHLRRR